MRSTSVLCSALVALCVAAGCNNASIGGTDDAGATDDMGTQSGAVFDVQPGTLQTITVTAGQQTPTIQYSATLDGQPCSSVWSVDRGDIGFISAGPSTSSAFSPRGTAGGLVTVRASCSGQTQTRQIQVNLVGTQNGANPAIPSELNQIPKTVGDLTSGGGVGGVGGEGLGVAVTDPATVTALSSPTSTGAAQNLMFLYPYNGTVWPRGILAPLLMWRSTLNDADAIKIDITNTSGSFTWSGTFGRPAILTTTKGPFIRHPIPQDVWDAATNSAGGRTPDGRPEKLTIKLTVAKGGVGYGPITETWTVAPARLSGTIYYQSYGTLLAKNLGGAVGGDKMFGGAVLSIRVGDTGPKLLAGGNGNEAQCRTCHSVAANGSQLITQRGDNYSQSAGYTIKPTGATEQALINGATFPAISPDGTLAIAPNGQLLPLPTANMSLAVAGLNTAATNLGTPAFGPSGSLLAFNPMASPTITNPTQKLVVMNFSATGRSASNPVVVVDDTGQPAARRPGWPAVFPDGNSVIFHHQLAAGLDGNGDGAMYTRKGAQAEIAWTGVGDAKSVVALNQLNGKDAAGASYLPKLLAPSTLACSADGAQVGAGSGYDVDHGTDTVTNYEPTVNPVATGGYAWVVFTSRRMYGSVAAIPPYCSDPRGVDLVQNITTKKLWVAAVDVNGKIATDASHPAFYLPAQEILAGNSRGFWVLDPCKSDGASCLSGDQCCNGYCEPSGASGNLTCSSTPANQCANVQDKCTTAANCCDPTNLCINGFCTQPTVG